MSHNASRHIDYIVQEGDVAFGKTDPASFTPEIRANMRELYDDKFGLFVHFGPYAQLEGMWQGEEVAAEWIMNRARIPVKDYETQAAGTFRPEKFSAREYVEIAVQAGMKFIVVTAKHHDGFAMFQSGHPYNLVEFASFGRDILAELAEECAQRGIKLGFYYSQSQDWHEEGAYGNTWDFAADAQQNHFDRYFDEKVIPQLEELCTNYGDLFMVWFDTPVGMTDEHCQRLMDVIKTNQPGALVNSRLGNGYGHFDVSIDTGKCPNVCTSDWLPDLKIPWQTHETVTQRGWGYTAAGGDNDRSADYAEFIYYVCNVTCFGGVFLLNVAPHPQGFIPPSQANSLRAIGDWLAVNGEAIYGADPSPLTFPPFAITSKPHKLYLHLQEFQDRQVRLDGILSEVTGAYGLADAEKRPLSVSQDGPSILVDLPAEVLQPYVTVIVLEIADAEARVVDETLQQNADGSIALPVANCQYAVRRISYNYEEQVTFRWGEHGLQRLIWTVDIAQPGEFRVVSEDNGADGLVYEVTTVDDTLAVTTMERTDAVTRKENPGTIHIDNAGRHTIHVHPTQPVRMGQSAVYKFKGLELIPV